MTGRRRGPRIAMTRAELLAAFRATGGEVVATAHAVGVTPGTLYQRMRRQGVTAADLALIRRGVPVPDVPVPTTGAATLGPEGVTLALADYALLRDQATQAAEAGRLAQELAAANRIIASLTRHLQERAA